MKNLLIALLAIFLISCEKEDDKTASWSDVGCRLYVFDKDGNDLLNPENENAYDFNEMELYYITNGEEVLYYNGRADNPKGIGLYEPELDLVHYWLSVPVNTESRPKYCVRIVKWNNKEQDVFNSELKYEGNNPRTRKIWINDELVWDIEDEEYKPRIFTLIK